jgi:outer membrane protein OmpA-like peptidoglycan-associated protein
MLVVSSFMVRYRVNLAHTPIHEMVEDKRVSIILPALTALIMSASAAKRPITYPSDPALTSGPMENFRQVYVDPNKVSQLLQPLTKSNISRPRAVITKDRVQISEAIFFSTGSAIIKPSSFPILTAVVAALSNNPGVSMLQIQGHTDLDGGEDDNLALSIRRARAVKAFLIAQGVGKGRLDSVGFGETRPVKPAETEAAGKANRRVEFVIQRWSDVPEMTEVSAIGEKPAEVQPPDGTSLEIANDHQIFADITVNGQKVGEVGPSTVAAIHGLSPGLYDVGFTHPTGYAYYRAIRTSKMSGPLVPGGKGAANILPNKGLPTPAE